jgi:DNA-binding response OmpR family regulator
MTFGPKILCICNGQTTVPSVLYVIQQYLQVVLESHPSRAFQRWIDEAPDMIIIDIEPLEPLALQVINQLREQAVIPILLLSFSATNKFMLEAYEAGVDDYILKPIEPSLLYQSLVAAHVEHSDRHARCTEGRRYPFPPSRANPPLERPASDPHDQPGTAVNVLSDEPCGPDHYGGRALSAGMGNGPRCE